MNKYLWPALIITAILVVAAMGYFFGYDNGSEQINSTPQTPQVEIPNETPENFYSGGTILKQGDDLYLEYTQGSTQGRTKLVLGDNTECMVIRESVPCVDLKLATGEIVTVNGKRTSQQITADSLFVTVPQPVPNTSDAFQESSKYGYFGTVTLKGYLEVSENLCYYEINCEEPVDYAYFIFSNSNNAAINKFASSQSGNTYVGLNKVGLGCLQADKNQIFYENDADIGYVTGSITGDDYTRLISATSERPVEVQIKREVYTGGRGAPPCYSHFRNFNVL